MVFASTQPTLPRWLCENILLGTLPWQHSRRQSFSRFSEVYTLHDSYLLGTYQSALHRETVLCLLWDALWLPETVTRQANQHEPIFLLIKATETLNISVSEGTLSKPDGQPRRILNAEYMAMDGQTVLTIDDIHHNMLAVVYTGKLQFLAMDSRHRLLNLAI